ncbi:MAG: hypothetical protein AAB426_10790 [Myxococcota bacterium]
MSHRTEICMSLATLLAGSLLAARAALAAPTEVALPPPVVEAPIVPAAPASPLVGDWPPRTPTVSIDVKGGTLAAALGEITERAHWDLVLVDPEGLADKSLTVRLSDRPAHVVLGVVLKDSGLQARLEQGILTVEEAPAGDEGPVLKGRIRDKIRGAAKGRHSHRDDRVAVGRPVRVEAGEEVGDAVAIGGPLTVAGHVRGDAVAVGGPLTLEAGAVVNGDAVAVGGPLEADPGAVVLGDRVAVSGPVGSLARTVVNFTVDGDDVHVSLPWFLIGFGATLLRAVALFVLALLLLTFAPERVARVHDYMTERPGPAMLGGIAIVAGFVPLIILLAITIIGIPLIPVAVFTVVALVVLGLTSFVTWIGERVPVRKGKKTPVGAMAMGVGILALVDLVPFVGTALVVLVGFFAAGAAMLSRFGSPPKTSNVPPSSGAVAA